MNARSSIIKCMILSVSLAGFASAEEKKKTVKKADTDVWYNYAGKKVFETKKEKKSAKKPFVPQWVAREAARKAPRSSFRWGYTRRTRAGSNYYYPSYYSRYGYGYGCYRPSYRGGYGRGYRGFIEYRRRGFSIRGYW